jgi:ubiquinone/menaquinone biosynthesis C-methylase UbiE
MKWLKHSQRDPLAVSMSGVKLADRVLVVGCSDPQLIAALATKAGLTGRACAVDDSADRVAEAARIVEREGALVETAASEAGTLPYDAASFDLVVMRDVIGTSRDSEHAHRAAEALRVLRPGGRCLVIEGAGSGLSTLFARRGAAVSAATVQQTLQQSGYAAVRTLAERDGLIFVEGIKRNA